MIPVSGQGTVIDPDVQVYLPSLLRPPFAFQNTFLFSHGWWTTAQAAMIDYSRFSSGLVGEALNLARLQQMAMLLPNPPPATMGNALEIGIHWPSMVSEDRFTPLDIFQPLTFYNRAAMADDVGEHAGASLLRLALEAMPAGVHMNFHLIGHSFGCRVVSSALSNLLSAVGREHLGPHYFTLILLEPAMDRNVFEKDGAYGSLLGATGVPNLRMLITYSAEDIALNTYYPDAWKVMHFFDKKRTALGALGPTPATPGAADAYRVDVGKGYTASPADIGRLRQSSLVVVNLAPLHSVDGYQTSPARPDGKVDHHSDIYQTEIYRLLAAFL
jgi:hypothetical protein